MLRQRIGDYLQVRAERGIGHLRNPSANGSDGLDPCVRL